MATINVQDWIEAVKTAEMTENDADSYYAGDKTASSGRHWTVYYDDRAVYPYAEIEANFFQWCLDEIPENSEAFRVWQASNEVCADDYHAIGDWIMSDVLADWDVSKDEDAQKVYSLLWDIAKKWQNMSEF